MVAEIPNEETPKKKRRLTYELPEVQQAAREFAARNPNLSKPSELSFLGARSSKTRASVFRWMQGEGLIKEPEALRQSRITERELLQRAKEQEREARREARQQEALLRQQEAAKQREAQRVARQNRTVVNVLQSGAKQVSKRTYNPETNQVETVTTFQQPSKLKGYFSKIPKSRWKLIILIEMAVLGWNTIGKQLTSGEPILKVLGRSGAVLFADLVLAGILLTFADLGLGGWAAGLGGVIALSSLMSTGTFLGNAFATIFKAIEGAAK